MAFRIRNRVSSKRASRNIQNIIGFEDEHENNLLFPDKGDNIKKKVFKSRPKKSELINGPKMC